MTVIRSSKLARYMVCAGYMHLDLPETEAGLPAQEGTAAGEYLQDLLENNTPRNLASNGIYINEEMKFHLNPLAQEIKSRAASAVLCEQRIDWVTRSGIILKGQYDASFVDHNGRLCVEDLKFGWGIVEVKNNWQLISYAIGEVIRRGQVFNEISLKIHQPRPHHEDGYSREWIVSYQELLDLKEQIELRMIDLANGLRELTTSKQCKYCAGAAEACPAFSKLFYRALEVTTEFHQDSLTEEEISRQLDQIKRAEEVIKIKHDSLIELGTSRIKSGKIIPGYIQVEKYSNRVWKTGISPDAVKLLTGKSIMEETMMTPAKAEKSGVSKELVKQLTHTVLTGMKLEKRNSTDLGNKIFGTNNPIL